jgi:DNA-binding transcriptional LysR family regulator
VHPGLKVQLTEASTPAQRAAMRRGRMEVAIVATGDGLPEYDLTGLRLTALRSARGAGVAVAESHPFAVRERIEPEDLADQGWVVGPRSGDAPEFGAWPGIAEPRITFTARDWPTRLGLVAAGLGIALVPGIAAQAVPRGVRWIPVHDDTDGLRRAVWAATNDNPSAAATASITAVLRRVAVRAADGDRPQQQSRTLVRIDRDDDRDRCRGQARGPRPQPRRSWPQT